MKKGKRKKKGRRNTSFFYNSEVEPPPLSKEEIEAMEALDASSDAG